VTSVMVGNTFAVSPDDKWLYFVLDNSVQRLALTTLGRPTGTKEVIWESGFNIQNTALLLVSQLEGQDTPILWSPVNERVQALVMPAVMSGTTSTPNVTDVCGSAESMGITDQGRLLYVACAPGQFQIRQMSDRKAAPWQLSTPVMTSDPFFCGSSSNFPRQAVLALSNTSTTTTPRGVLYSTCDVTWQNQSTVIAITFNETLPSSMRYRQVVNKSDCTSAQKLGVHIGSGSVFVVCQRNSSENLLTLMPGNTTNSTLSTFSGCGANGTFKLIEIAQTTNALFYTCSEDTIIRRAAINASGHLLLPGTSLGVLPNVYHSCLQPRTICIWFTVLMLP